MRPIHRRRKKKIERGERLQKIRVLPVNSPQIKIAVHQVEAKASLRSKKILDILRALIYDTYIYVGEQTKKMASAKKREEIGGE